MKMDFCKANTQKAAIDEFKTSLNHIACLRVSSVTWNLILKKKKIENGEHNMTWASRSFFNDMVLSQEGQRMKR